MSLVSAYEALHQRYMTVSEYNVGVKIIKINKNMEINTIVGVLKFIEDKRAADWEDRAIFNTLRDLINLKTA